jgi:hypothetical protein
LFHLGAGIARLEAQLPYSVTGVVHFGDPVLHAEIGVSFRLDWGDISRNLGALGDLGRAIPRADGWIERMNEALEIAAVAAAAGAADLEEGTNGVAETGEDGAAGFVVVGLRNSAK